MDANRCWETATHRLQVTWLERVDVRRPPGGLIREEFQGQRSYVPGFSKRGRQSRDSPACRAAQMPMCLTIALPGLSGQTCRSATFERHVVAWDGHNSVVITYCSAVGPGSPLWPPSRQGSSSPECRLTPCFNRDGRPRHATCLKDGVRLNGALAALHLWHFYGDGRIVARHQPGALTAPLPATRRR